MSDLVVWINEYHDGYAGSDVRFAAWRSSDLAMMASEIQRVAVHEVNLTQGTVVRHEVES